MRSARRFANGLRDVTPEGSAERWHRVEKVNVRGTRSQKVLRGTTFNTKSFYDRIHQRPSRILHRYSFAVGRFHPLRCWTPCTVVMLIKK